MHKTDKIILKTKSGTYILSSLIKKNIAVNGEKKKRKQIKAALLRWLNEGGENNLFISCF